ncbi:MAG: L-threonylcarbamoyladenylate synthase [candidate division WOR-3 bacterium]|nr:L-threonylcarbamoyladenylate synthase [candidate division WOR-3 bacterium]
MALVLKAEPPSYSPESIQQAGDVLRAGGVAVFPTETVYGVGADIRDAAAVGRVFVLKNRNLSQPLMAHCASPVQMLGYVTEVPEWVQPLVSRFWPGPLALILHSTDKVPAVVTGGGRTIGIRMVDHPVARDLLEELGAPIAGTSANLRGEPATSRFDAIGPKLLEQVDVALDAGLCGKDVPSTVLDVTCDPPRLLRLGAVSVQAIEAVVGRVLVRV